MIEENTHEGGSLKKVSGLYKDWFLDYASYVILDRAIPSIYDGFKPVQRRIMHSMRELEDGRYNKVANIVGNTMKYHPHGDSSITDAMVGIGQKEIARRHGVHPLHDGEAHAGFGFRIGFHALGHFEHQTRVDEIALREVVCPRVGAPCGREKASVCDVEGLLRDGVLPERTHFFDVFGLQSLHIRRIDELGHVGGTHATRRCAHLFERIGELLPRAACALARHVAK